MERSKDRTLHRRDVLKVSGLAAGGAVGMAAVAATSREAAAGVPESERSTGDYAETEHVKTYYKLAQF